MGTVLLIGAGGSLAQARSYRPVQEGETPPLDGNFFSKASALAARNANTQQLVDALRALLDGDLFQDPWELRVPGSLEQFFADVYYDVVAHRSQ
jgi:hypothetical protein